MSAHDEFHDGFTSAAVKIKVLYQRNSILKAAKYGA
jgi:hypothetical protein